MAQWLDEARIEVRSGDGGNGIIAWRREKYEPLGGPFGGNGGRGGSIYVWANESLNTLIEFFYKKKFVAVNGAKGGTKGKHGRSGGDLNIEVPVGTIVKDAETGEVIADLKIHGLRIMVAQGGRGGRGNMVLACPTNRSPHHCEPGERGITRLLDLELKIFADVGIIGKPNAGKSTLLSALSRARPKIADYPFSTLVPMLAVVEEEGGNYVIADIPGLIAGASEGVGLGHKFLRHIERTRLLLHLVDISSANPIEDIITINRELALYNKKLADVPVFLILNKSDIVDRSFAVKMKQTIEEFFKKQDKIQTHKQDKLALSCHTQATSPPGSQKTDAHSLLKQGDDQKASKAHPSAPLIYIISAATKSGLKELSRQIRSSLAEIRNSEQPFELTELKPDRKAIDRGDDGFMIQRKRDHFTVIGDRLERMVLVTDLRSPESLHHLHRVLRSMGVLDALLKAGAKPGNEVIIGKTSFIFGEELC